MKRTISRRGWPQIWSGFQMELEGTEVAVEQFSADIVARNLVEDSRVLIENQLDGSDHTHLGQLRQEQLRFRDERARQLGRHGRLAPRQQFRVSPRVREHFLASTLEGGVRRIAAAVDSWTCLTG